MDNSKIQLYAAFTIIFCLIVTPLISELVYAFAIYKLGRRPTPRAVGLLYVSFCITWAGLIALIMF